MSKLKRLLGVAALSALGTFVLAGAAQAQFGGPRVVPGIQNFNPNPLVAPGLTQAEYLSRVRAYARTAAQVPPWLYGYNPYPNPIVSTGPVFPGGGIRPSVPTPFGPAVTNPYTPIGSAYVPGVTNPYTPVGMDGASSYVPSYSDYYDPYGGALRGTADIVRSYGDLMTSAEQARIMREQAYQSRLDTIKKKFDLDMYIKANTPSYTELEARRVALTLKRVQEHASLGEITSGRSHNVLVDDLRKYLGKKVEGDGLPTLPEDVLLSLNVANPASAGSLGVVRDGKLPSWPAAIQEVIPREDRDKIEELLLSQVRAAEAGGKADPTVMKEVRKALDRARDELGKHLDAMSTTDYLNGKRFLNDLDLARLALQNGDAKAQFDYMKWARGGPKTIQEVADYLTRTGLRIAPSAPGDEGAYRAVYSALAALDVEVNRRFAGGPAVTDPYSKE